MIHDQAETILSRLKKHKRSYSAKVLYTILSSNGDTREVTYGAFHSLCEDIACLLTVQGAAKTRAILMYQDPLHFLVAFFGCLMAGCIAVPVSPPGKRKSLDSLRATIADCEARFLLSDRATLGALEQQLADTSVKCIFTELASPESLTSAGLTFPEIEPSDIAFLQYTSGSTGDPKGVMVSHGNLMANEAMIQEIVGSTGDDVTVSWLPLFHDMGLIGGALHPLYTGTRGVLLTPVHFLQNPFSWLQAISDYDATVSVAPNFAFDLCVRKIPEEKRKALKLSRWRVAICGAEPIQKEVVEDFISAYANQGFRREAFVASYGLAESTLYVTSTGRSGLRFLRFDKQSLENRRPELVRSEAAEAGVALCSNGKACQGSQVRIVDPDTGQPCPAGAIGEIWVSGAHVAQGYWGKQELTRQTFQARLDSDSLGYLRTGDLGAIFDGQIYVTGRLKDLIIIDGRNLYPQDVEAFVVSLHAAHGKNSTAVFAVPDGVSSRLVVIQEVERMHRKRFAVKEASIEVKRRIADEFSVGVQDVVYIRQGHLPKTSSGKVQRGKAKAMYHDSLFETYQFEIEAEAAANPSDGVPAQAAHKAADTNTSPSYQHIVGKIVTKLAVACKLEAGAIDVDRPFHDYGLSSVDGTVLTGELSREFGVTVDPTEIYDYPTARRLAEHVLRRASRSEVEPFVIAPAYQADGGTKLAVIGVACRFPGAGNKDAFWENLLAGVSSFSHPSAHQARRHYQPAYAVAGFVDDVDMFDAAYFNISPKEARVMDPQQRFLLQTVVHALNDAGIPQGALAGTHTGVAVGVSGSDYGRALFASRIGNSTA